MDPCTHSGGRPSVHASVLLLQQSPEGTLCQSVGNVSFPPSDQHYYRCSALHLPNSHYLEASSRCFTQGWLELDLLGRCIVSLSSCRAVELSSRKEADRALALLPLQSCVPFTFQPSYLQTLLIPRCVIKSSSSTKQKH
jgi:hypothetical protein